MAKEFEPYHPQQNNTFNLWEYKRTTDTEEEVVVDEKAVFLAECETLRQEAVQKGYEQGMQQAQAEILARKNELSSVLDLLQKPLALIDEQVSNEILQTIITVCQQCIAIELSVNPEKLHDLLQKIKNELPSLNNHRVLAMHPQDVAWVQKEFAESDLPGLHELLVADSSLSRGDFYLQGEHSELDGRLHTRLTTLFAKYITKDDLLTPSQEQD